MLRIDSAFGGPAMAGPKTEPRPALGVPGPTPPGMPDLTRPPRRYGIRYAEEDRRAMRRFDAVLVALYGAIGLSILSGLVH